MSPRKTFPLIIAMLTFSTASSGLIKVSGPDKFQHKVERYLVKSKKVSLHTRNLIEALEQSPMLVRIKPITSDPETWHRNGESTRSYTRQLRSRKDRNNKRQLAGAVIYLNENRVSRSSRSYFRGTLIHELVHALDLVSGRYHEDVVVREKRAVFFQNIWRQAYDRPLRSSYHRKFATLEYQQAIESGQVKRFIDHFYRYSDLP
jgi:hypothetical protein